MKFKKIMYFIIFVILIILIVPTAVKKLYPFKYSDYIYEYSKEYNLDPYLVAAVIKTESNFRPNAKSAKDAYGLMQITPETAKWLAEKMNIENFSVDMLNQPKFNIRMGCWYLNDLKKEFKNNMDLVLAAYNGGRGNVQKWLKDYEHSKDGKNLHYIPFKETDKYVKKVKVNYNIYKYLYEK